MPGMPITEFAGILPIIENLCKFMTVIGKTKILTIIIKFLNNYKTLNNNLSANKYYQSSLSTDVKTAF